MLNVLSLYQNKNPLDEARMIGSNLGRFGGSLASGIMQMRDEDKAQEQDAIKKQKVNEIIQEFNNHNSTQYAGMGEAQKYLKVARLLYPYDQAMSQRFEEESNALRKEGRVVTAKTLEEHKNTQTADVKKQNEIVDKTFSAYQTALGQLASSDLRANPDMKAKLESDVNSYRNALLSTERGKALLGQSGEVKTEEPVKENFEKESQVLKQEARTNITSQIGKASDGKVIDGEIDNIFDLTSSIDQYAQKFGLSTESDEIKSLNSLLSAKQKEINDKYLKKVDIGKQKKSEEAQQFGAFKDYVPSIETVKALETTPNQMNTQLGISELMKILSGTGVSDTERLNTMLALTSEEYQRQFRKKSEAYQRSFISKFIDNDQATLAEVANNAVPENVRIQLQRRIPKQASDWYEKTNSGKYESNKSQQPAKQQVRKKAISISEYKKLRGK